MKTIYREKLFKEIDPLELEGAMKIFTGLEKTIVNILLDNQALSINQIRNVIVDEMINAIVIQGKTYMKKRGMKDFVFPPSIKYLTGHFIIISDSEALGIIQRYSKFIKNRKPSMYQDLN